MYSLAAFVNSTFLYCIWQSAPMSKYSGAIVNNVIYLYLDQNIRTKNSNYSLMFPDRVMIDNDCPNAIIASIRAYVCVCVVAGRSCE